MEVKDDLETLHLLIQSDLEFIRFELKNDIIEMQRKFIIFMSVIFITNIVLWSSC